MCVCIACALFVQCRHTHTNTHAPLFLLTPASLVQWNDVLKQEVEDLLKALRGVGAMGKWKAFQAGIHKLKGTLQLCGETVLLMELDSLSAMDAAPEGWEDSGFHEFIERIGNKII